MNDILKTFTIWTDGACEPNPGPGGWAAIVLWDNKERIFTGFELHTTNNRMELMALIGSLEFFKIPIHAKVYSDSQYVVKGCMEWMTGWKKNNWRNGKLKNKDLWLRLNALKEIHKIDCYWVKGHSGIVNNERVDELACLAIEDGILQHLKIDPYHINVSGTFN